MRLAIASSLAVAVGIFAFAALFGVAGSALVSGLVAAAAAAGAAWWFHRRPPLELDEAAAPRGLRILAALSAPLALVQLARLAVFMVAPAATGCSWLPASDWEIRHSCVSAYYVAAELADSVANVYDEKLYSAADDDPARPRKARMIGPFRVDTYEYPPPFLLLPRALRLLAPSFDAFRSLWFGLNGGFILFALVALARALGRTTGTRALLLSPLVWLALPTLSTLQKGNVQAAVVAASMLAMLLFARGRNVAGGALLAFVTASKLFPGLLGVYLLARRQWRAAAWTFAFGLLFTLLTLLDLGWAPFAAFLDHAPGLLSGESFPAFRNPAATAINLSVPGVVFKLKFFGLPGLSFGASKLVGWIYTLIATAAVWMAGRRGTRAGGEPLAWLAILLLATLRSPFLPQAYAVFPPLWLLTLLAAERAPDPRRLAGVLAAWAALNIYWPTDWPLDPRWLSLLILVPQALTFALAAIALRRAAPLGAGR